MDGGDGNVTVGYEHGMGFAPARVRRAALLLARSWLVTGPIDDRSSTYSAGEGGTYSLIVPGREGAWTGIAEVDATIDFYSMRTSVAVA